MTMSRVRRPQGYQPQEVDCSQAVRDARDARFNLMAHLVPKYLEYKSSHKNGKFQPQWGELQQATGYQCIYRLQQDVRDSNIFNGDFSSSDKLNLLLRVVSVLQLPLDRGVLAGSSAPQGWGGFAALALSKDQLLRGLTMLISSGHIHEPKSMSLCITKLQQLFSCFGRNCLKESCCREQTIKLIVGAETMRTSPVNPLTDSGFMEVKRACKTALR